MDRRTLLATAAASVAGVAAGAQHMIAEDDVPWPDPTPRKVLRIDVDDIGHKTIATALAQGIIPHWASFMQIGTVFPFFWSAQLCSVARARALTGCESVDPRNWVGKNYPNVGPAVGPPAGPWYTHGMTCRKVKRGKIHGMTGSFWPSAVCGPDRFDEYLGSMANLNAYSWLGYYHWMEGDGVSGVISNNFTFATNRTAALVMADIAAGVEVIDASFNAIHLPLDVPPDNEPPGRLYSSSPNPDPALDLLQHLDYRLGQIVSAAIAAGYIVILWCDNGSVGSGKGTFTEGGLNTPLIVMGNGVPAQTSDRLVMATDFFKTVRRLAGAPLLPTPHSVDFVDAFLPSWGAVDAPRTFITVSAYPGVLQPPAPGTVTRCARDHRYKVVDDCGVVTFFDLQTDPNETTPRTPTTPREVAAYQALFAALP